LIVEAKVPAKCVYRSLILTNELYETTDWYNNYSSLNDSQAKPDKDGVLRIVVSATDPGVPNWVDTAGYPRGLVQGRWTHCNSSPVPSVRKVAFTEVRTQLPSDTPIVTPAQREALIRERGLEGQVLVLDHRPDVPALLRNVDIGLLLSEDEGLPNVLLEYMASNLPVVVARLPFIVQPLGHGEALPTLRRLRGLYVEFDFCAWLAKILSRFPIVPAYLPGVSGRVHATGALEMACASRGKF